MTTFGLDDLSSQSLEATSKGNQRKWQEHGCFIKADTFIEESKNEVLAYEIGCALGLNVTPYYFCTLSSGGQEAPGCYCQTFLTIALSALENADSWRKDIVLHQVNYSFNKYADH